MEEVHIQKLVHGGQGLGELADGRKVFVWNGLPGELVRARIVKKKRSYAEAIAEEIIEPSAERVQPREDNFLATSPWQVLDFNAENRYKSEIVRELFAHEKVRLPEFAGTITDDNQWHYRNKMEYSFWGDEQGIHLALHHRGSHGKQIVQGSALAMQSVDEAATAVCAQLNTLNVRASDLKTLVIRASRQSDTVASLFVKPAKFQKMQLPDSLKGLRVYHSNPKSPASVPTKLLYELGDPLLHDELLSKQFTYDVDSFFQVNIPVFEVTLARIKERCSEAAVTDMYAGVGSIGLSVASEAVDLIEIDPVTAKMAGVNAAASGLATQVIETSTEKALDYIRGDIPVVFDPPRAGLHDKVVQKVLAEKPPKIIYLSCNPATQARDLAKLQASYTIDFFEVYNFFPRTPHIETLAVLKCK